MPARAARAARGTESAAARRRPPRQSLRTTGRTAFPARAGASVLLDRHADHVAFAVDGLDDARRARVVAQRLAQTTDSHVDAAIERIQLTAAQQLHQLR